MTTAAGCFCWFECASTDARRVRPFYAELFDWSAEDDSRPGGGEYTTFRISNVEIAGLYQMTGSAFEGVPSHWATYVRVESVDRKLERATQLGAAVLAPAMDIAGLGRIAFVADPTGASIGLFEAAGHPGRGDPGRTHGGMGWSELATADPKRAREFYTALFDWTAKEDADGRYTKFSAHGRPIGGMATLPQQHQVVPHWMPYVAVDDCRLTAAKVVELGGHTVVAPTEIAGAGCFSVLADPAGACLAYIELKL